MLERSHGNDRLETATAHAAERRATGSRKAMLTSALASALFAGMLLGGCANTSPVVASSKPDAYVASASAYGGRLSWARADRAARDQAASYCEQRNMRASVNSESSPGERVSHAQSVEVAFECHPQ